MTKSALLTVLSLALTIVASALSSEGQKIEMQETVAKEVAKAIQKKGS